jgi:hypothetical protein
MGRNTRKTQPLIADVHDVQDFAATIKSAWVQCRSDGHDMRPLDVQITESNDYLRVKRCRRCGTERHQVINRFGIILHTRMEYPEGYQMEKGTGRLDSEGRGVFRAMAIETEFRRKTQSA